MGLFRRKDSAYWWISFTVGGKRYRISTETKDRKLAEKIYASILVKVAEGKWFGRDPALCYTFNELMERFMKEYAPQRKLSMVKRYECALVHLKKYFSDKTLSEITPDLISSCMHKRREEGAASATINRERAMLSKAFNLAVNVWGWIMTNPCQKVPPYPENNKRDRWLTWEEEERLLAASEPYLNGALRDIIILALNTGMRQGEIMNLRWDQIDFDKRVIILQETKTGTPRGVPLNNTVFKMLVRRYTERKNSEYVFSTRKGTKIGTRNMLRGFYKALSKAGISDFRFHDLRHTFATRLVQVGDQLYRIGQILGHSQVETTQRYAHHYLESLRPSVMLLDNLRGARNSGKDLSGKE
ncbi:MAG: site-specific integrase [Deltaproteobacteria bacterium]|nr:site-specific integrase [Deltaproteobacteria bacterium]